MTYFDSFQCIFRLSITGTAVVWPGRARSARMCLPEAHLTGEEPMNANRLTQPKKQAQLISCYCLSAHHSRPCQSPQPHRLQYPVSHHSTNKTVIRSVLWSLEMASEFSMSFSLLILLGRATAGAHCREELWLLNRSMKRRIPMGIGHSRCRIGCALTRNLNLAISWYGKAA